ncbi:MAG: polysaccharide deacetylase family protein [bacterium]
MNFLSSRLLHAIPLKFLKNVNYPNPLGLIYHLISEEKIPHTQFIINHKSTSQFKNDLNYLLKYYDPIDIQDIPKYNGIRNNKIFFSFDDGYREVFDIVAPILESKGINAGIFVPLEFIDNKQLGHRNKISLIIHSISDKLDKQRLVGDYLNVKDVNFNKLTNELLKLSYGDQNFINELAQIIGINFREYLEKEKPYLSLDQLYDLQKRGFYIGGHTIDHPYLQSMSLNEQVRQTIKSTDFFHRNFNNNINIFAIPFNNKGLTKEFYNYISHKADFILGTEVLGMQVNQVIERIEMENGYGVDVSLKKEFIKYFIRKNYF